MPKVLIVSGEPSGDVFAAGLIPPLKKLNESIYFYAMGGKNCAEAGAELIADIKELSVMGFIEVLFKLKTIKKLLNKVLEWIKLNKPEVIILVDFPSFNFKIAKFAYELGIPTVYFIPPKIWASRYGRINFIKKYIKFVINIFPFEQKIYNNEGVESYYFGNPLYVLNKKDGVFSSGADIKGAEKIKMKVNGKYPVIAFLPGSRKTELKYHSKRIIESISLIKSEYKDAFFIFPFRKEINSSYFETVLKNSNIPEEWYFFTDSMNIALSSSDVIVAASGTASLEACFYGKPIIIVYYLNYLTYILAKILVRIKYAGLINILGNDLIVPELIESKFTPLNVFSEVDKFLKNGEYKKSVLNKISGIISTLDAGVDPFDAAADIIYSKILKNV
ncbi:MAG: lipid-A-disaccharide synthase [Deltaproteobacteria bacterium]|nr:lipid-A-disaccharide synthase [Deltaproteobacteria bacterium]